MKNISKIIISAFISIILFAIILFLGVSLSRNSGDINTAGVVATIISLLPILFIIFKIINSKNRDLKDVSFEKNAPYDLKSKKLDLIHFIILTGLGILVYLIDNVIYFMIIGYTIFTN